MTLRSPFVLALIFLAAPACGGGSAAPDATGAGGQVGRPGDGGVCRLEPKGTFTLHVHNASATTVKWIGGCGVAAPFDLDTPGGTFPAGTWTFPSYTEFGSCGFTCDDVYAGRAIGCSECGNQGRGSVAPGEATDIAWDRRVYRGHTIEASCSAQSAGERCALGAAVPTNAAQTGTFHGCEEYLTFGCSKPHDVRFTIDTTKNDATIEL